MGTVTPTPVIGEGYVRVEANWQDVTSTRQARIYRQVAGVRSLLRDAAPGWLSNGIAVAFDHEAPLDTPLTYVSTVSLNANPDMEAGVAEWLDTASNGTVGTVTATRDYYVPETGLSSLKLAAVTGVSNTTLKAVSEFVPITADAVNSNPYFETNANDWSGIQSATVARTTANFHQGVAGLLITPNGVASGPGAQTTNYPVVAGQTYGFSMWLRVAAAGSLDRSVGIAWYNGSNVFISSSVITQSPTPGVWMFYTGSAVAPGGAAFGRLITQGPGVLAAANAWTIDEAVLVDPSTQRQYTIAGRLMMPAYWTGGIGVQLQWYTGTTLISTSGTLADVTPFPGFWGVYGFTSVSPPGANAVRLVAAATGTPPQSFVMYVDDMYLTLPTSTVVAADVVLPSSGGGWWTDPLHPATKIRLQSDLQVMSDCMPVSSIVYLGVSERTLAADAATTEVNDSPYPIATWNRRKSGSRSIGVGTMTVADRDQLESLHSSGAPLFLQLPPQYREADRYTLCGEVSFAHLRGDQRKPWRVSSTPYREVEAPIGPAEGTWNTRYMDLDKYATFATATAAGATWLDGLRGLLTA